MWNSTCLVTTSYFNVINTNTVTIIPNTASSNIDYTSSILSDSAFNILLYSSSFLSYIISRYNPTPLNRPNSSNRRLLLRFCAIYIRNNRDN